MSQFQKYIDKVENLSPQKRKEKQREAVLKAMEANKKDDGAKPPPKRCGGRGLCDIYGTWDGKRPHGIGKAKFLMVSSLGLVLSSL